MKAENIVSAAVLIQSINQSININLYVNSRLSACWQSRLHLVGTQLPLSPLHVSYRRRHNWLSDQHNLSDQSGQHEWLPLCWRFCLSASPRENDFLAVVGRYRWKTCFRGQRPRRIWNNIA